MSRPFLPGDKVKCIKNYDNVFILNKIYIVKPNKFNIIFSAGDDVYIGGSQYKGSTIDGDWLINHKDIYECFKLANVYKNHLPGWF